MFVVTLIPCILKLLIYALNFETTPIILLPSVSMKFIPRNPVEQCLEILCEPINHFKVTAFPIDIFSIKLTQNLYLHYSSILML